MTADDIADALTTTQGREVCRVFLGAIEKFDQAPDVGQLVRDLQSAVLFAMSAAMPWEAT